MKPNFALTLSVDGIGLLHRADAGWLLVGDVALDAQDLAGALLDLVGKARTLEPGGIRSKVVIPNQQIKYLQFESDSRDVDILEAQVRNALFSATPYELSELAYDWSMSGGEVHVAAVAIETLTEAESFAVDHGFGPLSFVAVPEDGQFQGEPFFGETVHAGEKLSPGEIVERDDDAIVIKGRAKLPEPEPAPQPKPAPAPDAKTEEPATGEAKPAPTEPEPAQPTPGFQSARQRTPAPEQLASDSPPAPDTKDEPASDDAEPAPVMSFTSARKSAHPADGLSEAPALPARRFIPTADADDDTPVLPPETPKKAPQEPAKAEAPKPAQPPKAPAPPQAPKSKAPPAPPYEAPSSVKKPEPVAEDEAQKRGATLREATPIRPSGKPAAPASKHPGRMAFLSRRKSDTPTAAPASPGKTKSATERWGLDIRAGLGKARAAASSIAKTSGGKLKPKQTLSAAERSAAQAREDEKQRMTVFGARNPDNVPTENNPRFMALALTAGLLLFLVGVAAWAALFLEDGISGLFRSSEDVQFAEEPAAIEAPAEIQDTPAEAEVAALPEQRETEELADEPLETLNPAPSTVSEELSPDEARARYAATGIWQMSPAAPGVPNELTLEEVYQTSLDPDLNFSDAVAIPNVTALLDDGRPLTPADPPPPGTDFERDDRGFILATPEGTITPEGFTLFSGRPALVPPAVPDRPEPEVAEADTAPEPALESANIRPRARPEDLNESFERSNNGGRTLAELQDIRPRLRPKSPQEQALEAAGISPVIEDDAEDQLEDATEQAVVASLKPRNRPSNFAETVASTRETAATQPVSLEQRVTVDIPTTASVARAATERNQISLRRVNLIGVYGSPDSRRALVRLPNGRYQKVKVGDKLDGGQVAAIGDDELRYVKRGQSLVLKMPAS